MQLSTYSLNYFALFFVDFKYLFYFIISFKIQEISLIKIKKLLL